MNDDMDFIKNMYEDGLVEKKLDEDAWADIRARRLERVSRERGVALYGYLVGIDNAMKAIKAAELAEEGKGIPPQFVKAYAPIFEMIDDFVNAGPGAIQRLKSVHKSIKKRQ
jgi:hypothetical protein